jgi:protoporphyrinogen oxidase
VPSPIRIIGGGMTGLTLALRLAQRGLPVVVHERDPYLGGLSSESTLGGIPIERYYHCVLPTDTALLALFREIGLEDAVQWHRTRTGFFHDGRLIEMTTTGDFLKFPALTPIDRARLGWTVAYCGVIKNWKRLDGEPVSVFLRRHGGERLFTSIWEPLLLAKLGEEYDRFSASFIWATIQRMLSARKHRDRAEKLGVVRGRYGRVFGALRRAIQSAGGDVQIGRSVTSVCRTSEREAQWEILVDGERLAAAGVVMCAPAPVAAEWIQESVPEAASILRNVEYLGVICEVLLLRRSLTPYYVLNLTDRRLPFTGVVEFTNLAGNEEFGGYSVVYLPRYTLQNTSLWGQHNGELHEKNMAGLRLVVPDITEGDIVAWHVHRARYVQPVHAVAGSKNVPGLVIAPKLAYLSSAQMHPWPVFNNGLVRHVDSHMEELCRAINPLGTH